MNITITAKNDGTATADGMTLGELERALQRIRLNGGQDDTQLDVLANRAHRVRSVTADVDETAAPAAPGSGFGRHHEPRTLMVTRRGIVTCDGVLLSVQYDEDETTDPGPTL